MSLATFPDPNEDEDQDEDKDEDEENDNDNDVPDDNDDDAAAAAAAAATTATGARGLAVAKIKNSRMVRHLDGRPLRTQLVVRFGLGFDDGSDLGFCWFLYEFSELCRISKLISHTQLEVWSLLSVSK